jgi:hypothetical protein
MAFPIKAITVALAFLNYAQLRYHFYFVLAGYFIYTCLSMAGLLLGGLYMLQSGEGEAYFSMGR